MAGNKYSIAAMAEKNKGKVAAFCPRQGGMIKLDKNEYQYLKGRGLAFHSNHPVTRLFRAVYNNYEEGNSVYNNNQMIMCYLPIPMDKAELIASAFWAMQGYNLAVKCDRNLLDHIKDVDARMEMKAFATKSLILAADGNILPSDEAIQQTKRFMLNDINDFAKRSA